MLFVQLYSLMEVIFSQLTYFSSYFDFYYHRDMLIIFSFIICIIEKKTSSRTRIDKILQLLLIQVQLSEAIFFSNLKKHIDKSSVSTEYGIPSQIHIFYDGTNK